MLYASWKKGVDVVASLRLRMCDNCTNMAAHVLASQQTKARLYGIPVAKWGKSFNIICTVCTHQQEVSEDRARQLTEWYVAGEVPIGYFAEIAGDRQARMKVATAYDQATQWAIDNFKDYLPPTTETKKEASLVIWCLAAHRTAQILGTDYDHTLQFCMSDIDPWLQEAEEAGVISSGTDNQ